MPHLANEENFKEEFYYNNFKQLLYLTCFLTFLFHYLSIKEFSSWRKD
jgi:hypothetical protein